MPQKSKFVKEIIKRLKKKYPKIKSGLNYNSALELLVATILAAQCTDKRVNTVTPKLFRKYRSATDYAAADLNDLEDLVHSTGFFRNKAKNLKNLGKELSSRFNKKVPDSLDDLISLPGVGRKTANVVLNEWFKKSSGIPVDTHVKRITKIWELTNASSSDVIEQDLKEIVPKKEWRGFTLRVIEHGRDTCKARKRLCDNCELKDICPGVKL
ncbi:endonuclease III [Candidatus Dojkabacteria bacterium]|nr:endonuclease III [Candidatus Dojkabacteria bacterium]